MKGMFYIAAGVASPALLHDIPLLAIIQTVLLIGMGSFNLYRAHGMRRS